LLLPIARTLIILTSKVKFLTIAIALTLTFLSAGRAQEWKLMLARPNATASVTVPAGHLIEFGSIRANTNGAGSSQTIDFGNGAIVTITNATGPIEEGRRYAGPVTITQSVSGGTSNFVANTYRITNTTSVSAIPSNAVVIPSNASGDVQIVLESSSDLITWTAALPGTYNSSTQNRFFRVRAIQP
jgi:hypothetical protein